MGFWSTFGSDLGRVVLACALVILSLSLVVVLCGRA
jgi:hypothetical protein